MAMAVPFRLGAAESMCRPMLAHSCQDVHRAMQQEVAGVEGQHSSNRGPECPYPALVPRHSEFDRFGMTKDEQVFGGE